MEYRDVESGKTKKKDAIQPEHTSHSYACPRGKLVRAKLRKKKETIHTPAVSIFLRAASVLQNFRFNGRMNLGWKLLPG